MSGIETYLSLEGPVNLMANGVDGIANAFTKAAPTADGHASIAAKLSCHLGQHTVGNEAIVWTWANDHSEATASFHCMSCDTVVTVQAEVTVESSATCTEAGKLTSTATFFIGKTKYQDIHEEDAAALGHNIVADKGKDASCTEPGLTDGSHCDRCGKTLTAQTEIPALGHDWQDATCTDPKICKVCDATEGSALGHSWDEGVVTKEPTEEETGARTYTCVVCQETKTEEIPCLNPEYNISRIYGEDRVGTAIAVADKLKEILQVETFDTIIIAVGDDFADALTGSYLANAKSAPILLYRASGIEQNEAYIQENLSEDGIVYILGGTEAIPSNVEERLVAAGYNVQRLHGETRFDTNLKILEAAGIENQEILICTGWDYADSLSASATGLPIVMVNTKLDVLTESQIAFFEKFADNQFTIIGGTGAVSVKLEAEIAAIVGEVDRVSGAIREETAVAIANRYFDEPDCALIAYSRNFPDGLCGGPLAYALKAPLLLVNDQTESAAANYVAENSIKTNFILGGTSAVSDESLAIIFPN